MRLCPYIFPAALVAGPLIGGVIGARIAGMTGEFVAGKAGDIACAIIRERAVGLPRRALLRLPMFIGQFIQVIIGIACRAAHARDTGDLHGHAGDLIEGVAGDGAVFGEHCAGGGEVGEVGDPLQAVVLIRRPGAVTQRLPGDAPLGIIAPAAFAPIGIRQLNEAVIRVIGILKDARRGKHLHHIAIGIILVGDRLIRYSAIARDGGDDVAKDIIIERAGAAVIGDRR